MNYTDNYIEYVDPWGSRVKVEVKEGYGLVSRAAYDLVVKERDDARLLSLKQSEMIEELAAQVDVLREKALSAYDRWNQSRDVFGGMQKLMQAVEATPATCLAQVKADAAKLAYVVALNNWGDASLKPSRYNEIAEEYAESIRQGVV